MEIVIINCPETIHQTRGLLFSSDEDEISPNGYIQLKLIELRLKDCMFDQIYCSDMKTSKESIQEIHNDFEEKKVIFTEKLRERNFGFMYGKSLSHLNFIIEKKQIPFRKFKPFNGENMIEVYIRAQEFLQELIVSHFNPNSVFPKLNLFKYNYFIEQKEKSKNIAVKTNEFDVIQTNLDKSISNCETNSIISEISDLQTFSKDILENITKEKARIKENIKEIIDLIISYDFDKHLSKLYKGFNGNDNSMKRVLVLTHATFIQELVNAVKIRKGLEISVDIEEPKPASFYVIRVWCGTCENICLNISSCKIRMEILVYNDVSHLSAFCNLNEKMKSEDN